MSAAEQWVPSVGSCLWWLATRGGALAVVAVVVVVVAANRPGGLLDRVVSAIAPGWMGEDR